MRKLLSIDYSVKNVAQNQMNFKYLCTKKNK